MIEGSAKVLRSDGKVLHVGSDLVGRTIDAAAGYVKKYSAFNGIPKYQMILYVYHMSKRAEKK